MRAFYRNWLIGIIVLVGAARSIAQPPSPDRLIHPPQVPGSVAPEQIVQPATPPTLLSMPAQCASSSAWIPSAAPSLPAAAEAQAGTEEIASLLQQIDALHKEQQIAQPAPGHQDEQTKKRLELQQKQIETLEK